VSEREKYVLPRTLREQGPYGIQEETGFAGARFGSKNHAVPACGIEE
jgi:hypothetical protein